MYTKAYLIGASRYVMRLFVTHFNWCEREKKFKLGYMAIIRTCNMSIYETKWRIYVQCDII